jgi:hypothetical protein
MVFILVQTLSVTFGQKIKHTIYFDFNKFDLTDAAFNELEVILEKLDTISDYAITVIGHTDTIGNEKYNTDLSLKRANSVINYLVENNIDTSKIKVLGKSFNQPKAPNIDEYNRQLNRRVEIYVTIFPPKKPTISIPIQDTIKIIKKDTTLIGNKGTKITFDINAFYPHKIEDLKIDIKEVFTPKEMADNRILTQTINGQCLTTFGMVFITVTTNKNEKIKNSRSVVEIKIPAIKGVDNQSKLFVSRVINGKTVWKPLKGTLIIDTTSNTPYYVFYTTTMSGFNIDKYINCNYNRTVNMNVRKKLKNPEIYIYNEESNNIQFAKNLKKNRYVIRTRTYNPIVFITIYYKDKKYTTEKPLSQLRYNWFTSTYIIRKKDFEELN